MEYRIFNNSRAKSRNVGFQVHEVKNIGQMTLKDTRMP